VEHIDGKVSVVHLNSQRHSLCFDLGDWSDGSRLWTENGDLRQELLNERDNRRDGVFWMPFQSFVKYFECVDICKLRNNWYEVRDTGNFYPTPKHIQGKSKIRPSPSESVLVSFSVSIDCVNSDGVGFDSSSKDQ
jgi:hypothetical protein